ncbi:hypothetical protein VW35_00965 [Devosia soli]|uniref:Uncharacterized protein n=1 Tax=Devosia soli TaxID=361041 RepID=A0A0F5LGV9_9HYPH|nr:hypothetical protein [Devosia soli]KKB80812.1 hypothetical protein VW35_00965 [Devosia soli]
MVEISALLKQIEAYCQRHEIEETTFGLRAVNDGKFVARLRAGKTIQLKTLHKVTAFMKRKPARVAA